jgi:DNA polymerase III delta subunit
MMPVMTILHGEHELASRQKLIELVAAAKASNRQVKWLDGKKLTLAELELAVGSDSLFGTPQTLIIEQIYVGPKSKRKDELVAWLKQQAASSTAEQTEIIQWETKTLTATQLKSFPTAQVQLFKLSNALFTWLDSLSPQADSKARQLKLLAAACEAESPDFCLIMLIRQVRLLMQAKENNFTGMAPFTIQKITQQARQFSAAQLYSLHSELFRLDQQQKTGTGQANLRQELDLLVVKL